MKFKVTALDKDGEIFKVILAADKGTSHEDIKAEVEMKTNSRVLKIEIVG